MPDSLSQQKYFNLAANQPLIQEEIDRTLSNKIDSLRSVGYFSASIDSTKIIDDAYFIYGFLGKRYQINQIINQNIEATAFNLQFANQENLSWQDVELKKKKIVDHYVGEGFISAEVQLTNTSFQNEKITSTLVVKKGPQYVLDSVIIKGNLEINNAYLYSLLSIEKGQILNETFFENIKRQINGSEYLKMDKTPQFQLLPEGKAIVYLPINEKAANEFDLLIGFLPNPNPRLSANNLLITGEGRLQLFNPFGQGREFFVDYKQLQPESPRLETNLFFPRFVNTNFGLVGSFDLFKQDTSFVSLNSNFGFRYNLPKNKKIDITYNRARSFIQTVDTNFVKQQKQLPPIIDFTQNTYEANFNWINLNQVRNPSNGFRLNVLGGIGNRTITENENVTSLQDDTFDYRSLYNGINDDKTLVIAEFNGEYYFPLLKRSAILLQNKSGLREVNQFFENDLYRLGGFKSIRGFDEQSYLASTYTITTGEYRFLLNQDSYFSVFSDWGILIDEASDTNNQLLGIGSGLDLATQAGIFSLNLAIGQDDNNPFDFNKTRVHIGYVNVF